MIFQGKRKKQAAANTNTNTNTNPDSKNEERPAHSGAYETYSFPVFDGQAHGGTLVCSRDANGRPVYRLRKEKGWASKLSHIVR